LELNGHGILKIFLSDSSLEKKILILLSYQKLEDKIAHDPFLKTCVEEMIFCGMLMGINLLTSNTRKRKKVDGFMSNLITE